MQRHCQPLHLGGTPAGALSLNMLPFTGGMEPITVHPRMTECEPPHNIHVCCTLSPSEKLFQMNYQEDFKILQKQCHHNNNFIFLYHNYDVELGFSYFIQTHTTHE